MAKRLWTVNGRADATFYVFAETEDEALDNAQQGDYVTVEFKNVESYYEEASEVEAE